MSSQAVCSICNAPLAADRRDGLCPTCAEKADVPVFKGAAIAAAPTSSQEDRATQVFSPAADPIDLTTSDRSSTPLAIPGYELLREISRGGQGVVYQAIQLSTKRKVAIKVLLEGHFASRASRKRFEREIELVASLKHPNIISVFDSGVTPDGHPYYVMDYVRGLPITAYIRGQHLPLNEALRMFALVAGAVSHAHYKGIIHRDLKPSNILIDSDGAPRILDFGLAKTLTTTEESVFSLTGQVVGTLPYMSPEQTGGNPDEIDTRTDVYSLGVILYEILTGKSPYPVAGTLAEVIRNITQTEPLPLARAWTSDSGIHSSAVHAAKCPVDHELEIIARKALAKHRDRRYQSAGELARDVNNYLTGAPLDAKRDSALYLISKAIQRNKLPVAIATAFAVIVLGSVVALSILYSRQGQLLAQVQIESKVAEQEKSAALTAEAKAKTAAEQEIEQRRQAEEQLHLTRLAVARANVELNDFPTARNLLVESKVPQGLDDDWRWIAWAYFHRSRETVSRDLTPSFPPADRERFLDRQGRGSAKPMYLDVAHKRIVVGTDSIAVGQSAYAIGMDDGQIVPLEISVAHPLELPGIVVTSESTLPGARTGPLKISDGVWVVLRSRNDGGSILLLDKPALVTPTAVLSLNGDAVKPLSELALNQTPTACTVSHDRKMVVVGFNTGRIDGYRLDKSLTGVPELSQIFSIQGYREAVAFGADDREIRSISDGLMYRVWLWKPTPDLSVLPGHTNTIRHIAFSPDGSLVASGGYDGHVHIFNIRTQQLVVDLTAYKPTDNFGMLEFFPDGRHLITGGSDSYVRIWDVDSTELRAATKRSHSPISSILENAIDLLRSSPAPEELDTPVSAFKIGHTARGDLSADGPVLYATNGFQFAELIPGNASLEQWDLRDLARPRKIASFDSTPGIYMPYNIRLLPRQHLLFAVNSTIYGGGDAHEACQIYDTSTSPPTPGAILDDGNIDHRDLDLSPDGSVLALSTWQGTVSLWDWQKKRRLAVLDVSPGHSSVSVVSSVRFHPKWSILATACHDSRVNLFSTESFRKLATIDVDPERKLAFGAHGPLKEAAFSPDGKLLAIGAGNDLWLVDLSYYDEQIRELAKERDELATRPNTSNAAASTPDMPVN